MDQMKIYGISQSYRGIGKVYHESLDRFIDYYP